MVEFLRKTVDMLDTVIQTKRKAAGNWCERQTGDANG